ncbi:syndrome ATP-dependent helicase homolog [Seminavis robusta]|uniref:DNA 3'-5' helicase n=1 Tax=Seminavis robusta TaxID=568900 RepID=A0A9N8DKH8_9STRA|nr:syndrome ATP-dependent helicase homolog [Seminavis robusta]|eukprot:Sro108_g054090.1 syndrome ATP-dependent helicase homolog (1600) ;mRNA; f:13870-18952
MLVPRSSSSVIFQSHSISVSKIGFAGLYPRALEQNSNDEKGSGFQWRTFCKGILPGSSQKQATMMMNPNNKPNKPPSAGAKAGLSGSSSRSNKRVLSLSSVISSNKKEAPKTDTILQLEKLLRNDNKKKKKQKNERPSKRPKISKDVTNVTKETEKPEVGSVRTASTGTSFGGQKTSLSSLVAGRKKLNPSSTNTTTGSAALSSSTNRVGVSGTTAILGSTISAASKTVTKKGGDPRNHNKRKHPSTACVNAGTACSTIQQPPQAKALTKPTRQTKPDLFSTTRPISSETSSKQDDASSSEVNRTLITKTKPAESHPPQTTKVSLQLATAKARRSSVASRKAFSETATNTCTDTPNLLQPASVLASMLPAVATTNAPTVPSFLSTNHTTSTSFSSSTNLLDSSATTTRQTSTFESQSQFHSSSTTLQSKTKTKQIKPKPVNNDNFVRQNLRNSAGACRGARSKTNQKRLLRRHRQEKWQERERYSNNKSGKNQYQVVSTASIPSTQSRRTGLDPLDDYLDGVYQNKKTTSTDPNKNKTKSTKAAAANEENSHPKCARHQLPCKLLVVKKNTTGNKGRKFYACSMPKGEQCDYFEWADDTTQAAARALLANRSYSGFVARQVAAYTSRFQQLTVPELKQEAAQRGLTFAANNSKKKQLVTRLSIWVRDELSKLPQYKTEKQKEDKVQPAVAAPKEQPAAAAAKQQPSKGDAASKATDECDGSDVEDDDDSESDDDDDDESSDEELEFFASEKTADTTETSRTRSSQDVSSTKDEMEDEDEFDDEEEEALDKAIADLDMDDLTATPQLRCLRDIFSLQDFRPHQEWAIQRCLDHKRTLLVAPTGFGKSLCYALPAAMMSGICIVVSPLISLIQDQLRSLPPRVPAATLSGSLTAAATAAIVDDIVRNRIKVLFISPERLVSASFRRLFRPVWDPETKTRQRTFPDISLLCIDEAHCASQWAHNFRPCFLRFKHFLNLLNPKSVLAITATAEPRVVGDICNTLGIEQHEKCSEGSTNAGDSLRILKTDRDNIDVECIHVTSIEERLAMLSKILSPRPRKSTNGARADDESTAKLPGCLAKGSVIVYVWRQKDTEVVAEQLTDAGVAGGVVVYHGGMNTAARTKSQSRFMRGKARICVATVAFGLGIDKADIEGVVHVNLSASLEHYLQEIGRAGRDGRPAKAISMPFLEEIPIRHSLVHTDLISRSQVRAILLDLKERIAKAVDMTESKGGPVHVILPLEVSVLRFDCKHETIETILSLIERDGGESPILHVEGITFNTATIALKKRPLSSLAKTEDIARAIKDCSTCVHAPVLSEDGKAPTEDTMRCDQHQSKFEKRFLAYSQGAYSFSVIDCVNRLGPSAEPRHVYAALRRLQSNNELELSLDTTAAGRGLHVIVHATGQERFNDDSGEWVEELAESLTASFHNAVNSSAKKVVGMYRIMKEVADAANTKSTTTNANTTEKSAGLARFQELTSQYFSRDKNGAVGDDSCDVANTKEGLLPDSFHKVPLNELRNDAVGLLSDLPQLGKHSQVQEEGSVRIGDARFNDYTAMAIAKFLHGLDAPRVPMRSFYSHPLFGKWKSVEFESVLGGIEKLMETSEGC